MFRIFWYGVWACHVDEFTRTTPRYWSTPAAWTWPVAKMSGISSMIRWSSASGAIGVMVPREHDDGDAVREVRDHPCERLVLTVDVIDCEFLVLTRVDADAVHDVSAHDEVADRPGDLVGAPEPCGHFRPLVLEECAAPDVNVGHERRADVVTGSSERLDGRQVWPNDRLGDHEPSVVDGPDDSDDFVQDGDLRGDGRLRRKEDRDPVRLVLDFQDPVAVLRRAHVRDDADDPHLARRSAGLRDLLGPPQVVAGAAPIPQGPGAVPGVTRGGPPPPLPGRMGRDVPPGPHVRVLVC